MILRTNRAVSKTIRTTQGDLTIKRYALRGKTTQDTERLKELEATTAIYPLDIALGIDRLPFRMTPDLMLKIAYTAIQMPSYERTEDIVRELGMFEIGDDTIRAVTNYIGDLVHRYDALNADTTKNMYEKSSLNFPHNIDGILYMTTDGATVNTRLKDESGSSYRENKLIMAYDSNHMVKYVTNQGEICNRIIKREYASYIGSVNEFKWYWLDVALRAGYGKYRETVILSDGAPWIRNVHKELFPDAQRILDLFHLKEKTGEYFHYIFPKDTQLAERKSWTDTICEMLENGNWKDVLVKLKPFKRRKLPKVAPDLAKYIDDNNDAIDYPAYKSKGYVVGSGSIESSNKTVLQSRLKQAGMRWNVEQGQAVVALKAKAESGMWSVVRKVLYDNLDISLNG